MVKPNPRKPEKKCVRCGANNWELVDEMGARCRMCGSSVGYSKTWGWV